MKSLIYYGPGKLAMEERPIPETGSKDVLVKVARARICTLNAVLAVGCQKPVVVDMNEERLKLIEDMGAVGFNPQQGDLKEFLINHFDSLVNYFEMKIANVDAFIDYDI